MEKESLKQLIENNNLVLVDFYATWCGPCQRMHPVLDSLKQEMGDNIRIAKIDIDTHPDLVEQHRIQSVPTLMLFRNGQLEWRESGGMSLEQLKARIS